jgi:hypothetical protein
MFIRDMLSCSQKRQHADMVLACMSVNVRAVLQHCLDALIGGGSSGAKGGLLCKPRGSSVHSLSVVKKNDIAWNLATASALMQMSPAHCTGGDTAAKDASSLLYFAGETHFQEWPAAFIFQPPSGRPFGSGAALRHRSFF